MITSAPIVTKTGPVRPLMTPIEGLCSYECPALIRRFRRVYQIGLPEASELFSELKKWTWLCAKRKAEGQRPLPADPALSLLLEMWNCFSLMEDDYLRYCERFFGNYIAFETGEDILQDPVPDIGDLAYYLGAKRLYFGAADYDQIEIQFGRETPEKWFYKFRQLAFRCPLKQREQII